MYNQNILLHMIGFPNIFHKSDQYVQNGILVEVAISKTISHDILVATLPFIVKPLWDIQPSSFGMWFAHTVNSGFGRTSQVKLQGSRRSRSIHGGLCMYIHGNCNATYIYMSPWVIYCICKGYHRLAPNDFTGSAFETPFQHIYIISSDIMRSRITISYIFDWWCYQDFSTICGSQACR